MPVRLDEGRGAVELRLASGVGEGGAATVLLYGATVVSWRAGGGGGGGGDDPDGRGRGRERLFLSRKAALDGSAPVRGGIPVVFPLFGNLDDHRRKPTDGSSVERGDDEDEDGIPRGMERLPKHGFARSSTWRLVSSHDDVAAGKSSATFGLSSRDGDIARVYPWPFELRYTVTLSSQPTPTLSCTLAVEHLASSAASPATNAAMPFQALLHNYLAVPSARDVVVDGVSARAYTDKEAGGALFPPPTDPSSSQPLRPGAKPTDRVYQGGAPDVLVSVGGGDKQQSSSSSSSTVPWLHVRRSPQLRDTTVWNPGERGGAALADLHEGGWDEFVCVEPGSVVGFERLRAGETWTVTQHLSLP